jgi:NADP-dependent 3-hydroxy acid dehydrogenase YdfG
MVKKAEVLVITGASAGVGRATVRAFGFLQYLLWGWPMERSKRPARHQTRHSLR